VTDCNAAFFDAANNFSGCIPGIHEVLRRQGLISSTLCLNPRLQLSPGQFEEIDRVCAAYPDLNAIILFNPTSIAGSSSRDVRPVSDLTR